jgi:hypothetical protein
MTGGSDFHGDSAGRLCGLGGVGMPREAYDALMARVAERTREAAAASGVEASVRA